MAAINSHQPLLPEIFALHGKWRGHKEALIFGEQRLLWAELTANANRVANGLLALGLKPGDRVVLFMSNSVETVEAILGIMAAAAVSVPLNLSLSKAAIQGMITDSAATAVICSDDQLQHFPQQRLAGVSYISTGKRRGWLNFADMRDRQAATAPALTINASSLLNIIYSSGTTGAPKGIAHTHQGRRDWAYDLAIALRYHGSARTLISLGLYSNISWVALLTTLLAGGTVILQRQFDPADFWLALQTERISHSAMVPVQYQRIAASYNAEDTSSISSLMSCGSPLHIGLKKQLVDIFGATIIELYGLTEGIITTLEPEEMAGRWSSVGKPLIGTDIAIIDANDQLLPAGEMGEIVSCGRITMPFYFNRDDATEQALWRDSQQRQWLRSGDIGYLDAAGYLYIVDRKKDMILSGSQNIYPQDIEAVLIEHPAVGDVAVIAAPSRKWGETPIALIVPTAEAAASEQAIQHWCNEKVGRQQRISDVIFIDELPRNPNGKVLKRELRARYGSNKRY